MRKVSLTGYASLDYPIILAGAFKANWTTEIRQRPADSWPRPGGCHFYAALPLVRGGFDTSLITWVGGDDMGRLYRRCCTSQGIGLEGFAEVAPGTTPVCFLVYQADGSCACLIDFGFSGRETLIPAQERRLRASDLVCITVGPPATTARALEIARPEATVAWVSKNDPNSFTPELCQALGRRAHFIFCNAQERRRIDECAPERPEDQVVVETHGAGAVTIHHRRQAISIPVEPVPALDTTGAGDTLAGGTLAAIAAGETDLSAAVTAGIVAARELLAPRVQS
jgi:ribokinase